MEHWTVRWQKSACISFDNLQFSFDVCCFGFCCKFAAPPHHTITMMMNWRTASPSWTFYRSANFDEKFQLAELAAYRDASEMWNAIWPLKSEKERLYVSPIMQVERINIFASTTMKSEETERQRNETQTETKWGNLDIRGRLHITNATWQWIKHFIFGLYHHRHSFGLVFVVWNFYFIVSPSWCV